MSVVDLVSQKVFFFLGTTNLRLATMMTLAMLATKQYNNLLKNYHRLGSFHTCNPTLATEDLYSFAQPPAIRTYL